MPSRRSPRERSWYSARPLRTLTRRFSMRTPVWMRSTAILSLMQPWYKCTKVSVKHRGHDLVFFAPDLLHPAFEAIANFARLGDGRAQEVCRDLDPPDAHLDPRQ